MSLITVEQFIAICPNARIKADLFVPWLNKYFEEYKINTPLRIAAFMAQAAHETVEFRYMKEFGSNKYLDKYDTGTLAKNLGNSPEDDDDGILYCGRGIFQVTGKANYRTCSRALFNDERLLTKPQLLEDPQYAVKSACWYWNSRNLSELSDKPNFLAVCIRVNGKNKNGLPNGWDDRKKYYDRSLKAMGVIK